jgi:general nucleoside transport system permease protein
MINAVVVAMVPLLLTALGGLFSERAGVLNIALEGLMLIGAFASILFTDSTGSIFFGVLLGVLSSGVLAFLFASTSVLLKTNIFITGLGINLLAAGLTTLLSSKIFETKGVVRFKELPPLGTLDLGGALGEYNIFVLLALLFLIFTIFLLRYTHFGLLLRATGMDPVTVRVRGKDPDIYKVLGITISGVGAGLGGAALSLTLGAYVPDITSGRGWMSLVIIYLGFKKPEGIFLAALLFALADTAANRAQGLLEMPNTLLLAFPYLITCLGLVLFSALQRRGMRIRGGE